MIAWRLPPRSAPSPDSLSAGAVLSVLLVCYSATLCSGNIVINSHSNGTSHHVIKRQKLFVECKPEIFAPNVTWLKDDVILNQDEQTGSRIVIDNDTLLFHKISEEDKGLYTCRADGNNETTVLTMELSVGIAVATDYHRLPVVIGSSIVLGVACVIGAYLLSKEMVKMRNAERDANLETGGVINRSYGTQGPSAISGSRSNAQPQIMIHVIAEPT